MPLRNTIAVGEIKELEAVQTDERPTNWQSGYRRDPERKATRDIVDGSLEIRAKLTVHTAHRAR